MHDQRHALSLRDRSKQRMKLHAASPVRKALPQRREGGTGRAPRESMAWRICEGASRPRFAPGGFSMAVQQQLIQRFAVRHPCVNATQYAASTHHGQCPLTAMARSIADEMKSHTTKHAPATHRHNDSHSGPRQRLHIVVLRGVDGGHAVLHRTVAEGQGGAAHLQHGRTGLYAQRTSH
jgi:hypothetical protein